MTMNALVNNKEFENFTQISFVDNIENLCNQFRFACTGGIDQAFTIPRGSSLSVLINGTQVLPGAVEICRVKYSAETFDVSVEGRDLTKAVIKSDLPPDFNLKGPISLKSVLEKTLKAIGVSIEVVDEIDGLEDYTNKEVLTEDVGKTVWDFWSKLAEKRQCLITKNRSGQIVITRPNNRIYKKKLLQLKDDTNNQNNIISAEADSDDTQRRSEWNIVSQVNVSVPRKEPPPAAGEIWAPEDTSEDNKPLQNSEQIDQVEQDLSQADAGTEVQRVLAAALTYLNRPNKKNRRKFASKRSQTSGVAIDESVIDGVRWETAEDPSDDDECERIAARKLNTSRVESISYRALVQDLEADDAPWESGWLVPVKDEIADIDSLMLIRSAEYKSSLDENGNASEECYLTMTIPDGYSEDANPSATQTRVSVIGENFNLEPLR